MITMSIWKHSKKKKLVVTGSFVYCSFGKKIAPIIYKVRCTGFFFSYLLLISFDIVLFYFIFLPPLQANDKKHVKKMLKHFMKYLSTIFLLLSWLLTTERPHLKNHSSFYFHLAFVVPTDVEPCKPSVSQDVFHCQFVPRKQGEKQKSGYSCLWV